MGKIRKAVKTFSKAGDLDCVGRGFTVGNEWGYAIFRIVDMSCELDEQAIAAISQFCEEDARGDSITVVPCNDRPELTIKHNGSGSLTITFANWPALYSTWTDDLAEVAKAMARQAEVATEEAKRKKSGCIHQAGYNCKCKF